MQSQSSALKQWGIPSAKRLSIDPLLDSLVLLTEHFGNPCSAKALQAGLPITNHILSPELFPQAAQRAGLSSKLVRKGLNQLPAMLLPCVLLLKDKQCCILQEIQQEQNSAIITLPETGGQESISLQELESRYIGLTFLVKQQYRGCLLYTSQSPRDA